jgi:hypothetical protein
MRQRVTMPIWRVIKRDGYRDIIERWNPRADDGKGGKGAYRRGNNPRCAICADNFRGNNESTWSCIDCRYDDENNRWEITPSDEVGDDAAVRDAVSNRAPSESPPGKYETGIAVDVMRLYCLDVGSTRVIARLAGCSQPFVLKTIAYWRDNYGYSVDALRELFINRVYIPTH